MSWGTMPYDWIENGCLREFSARPRERGRNIAALKCYLALASDRDFHSGLITITTNDLSQIAGISKPPLLQGIHELQERGLVTIEGRAVRNTNRYCIPIEGRFSKVPQDAVFCRLGRIRNRGKADLAALKLYLFLLHSRDDSTGRAIVGHRKVVEKTGIDTSEVAAAGSILSAEYFIQIRLSEAFSRTGHPTNEYHVLGDFKGGRRVARPSDLPF